MGRKGSLDYQRQCEIQEQTNGRSKKRRRRQKYKPSPVQILFNTCTEVFASSLTAYIPPPLDVDRLRSVLDILKPSNVGLSLELPYFSTKKTQRRPTITYLHVYECDRFSIGIFCLPPSAVIPLHNHPGMTVFSKLLMGSMHIKSYDWAVTSVKCEGGRRRQLARVAVDDEFQAPCGTSVLYPDSGGNMHCFTALTACAVLDVLGPPYSDAGGRPCSYYLEFPLSSSDDCDWIPEEEREKHAWLEEREKPDDLVVVGAPYKGPKFVEANGGSHSA